MSKYGVDQHERVQNGNQSGRVHLAGVMQGGNPQIAHATRNIARADFDTLRCLIGPFREFSPPVLDSFQRASSFHWQPRLTQGGLERTNAPLMGVMQFNQAFNSAISAMHAQATRRLCGRFY